MHAFGTLATVALVLGAVDAKCYGGWSLHRNTMKGQIAAACDSKLQGDFGAGESKTTCVEINSGNQLVGSVSLEVKNSQSFSGHIGSDDCKHQLTKLVDNCYVALGPLAYGGEDNVSGWFFKSDANAGGC